LKSFLVAGAFTEPRPHHRKRGKDGIETQIKHDNKKNIHVQNHVSIKSIDRVLAKKPGNAFGVAGEGAK
jgi:hypothetical protein